MDGETFLRRFLEIHAPEADADDERVASLLQQLEAAAEALVSVGSLDEDRAFEIVGELRERFRPAEQGLYGPPGPVGATLEDGPMGWAKSESFPPPPRLDRVIPVVQAGTIDGLSVTLTSLDIWTDHITVHAVVWAESNEIQPPLPWAWSVRDDTGALYSRGGGGSGGSPRTFSIESDFHPAPSPDASQLIVRARRLRPVEDVHADRMLPVTGIPAEELLRFDVSLR